MKKLIIAIFTLTLTLAVSSCKEAKETETITDVTTPVKSEVKAVVSKITLEKLTDSPAYTDAVLQLEEPSTTMDMKSGETNFKFNVLNYELGAQTQSDNVNRLANSGKGQHIHFILNNQPYSAHYDASFTKEIPDGTHHLVAFLSRSYHESVKNDNSVVVKKLMVGENATDKDGMDMEAPTLIYSRPKGTYKGKDADNVLLDFFVLNTELSENGTKVKATINGQEFLITEWTPHVIKGLPIGETTIELELVDASGAMLPGIFNKVTRTVTISE